MFVWKQDSGKDASMSVTNMTPRPSILVMIFRDDQNNVSFYNTNEEYLCLQQIILFPPTEAPPYERRRSARNGLIRFTPVSLPGRQFQLFPGVLSQERHQKTEAALFPPGEASLSGTDGRPRRPALPT